MDDPIGTSPIAQKMIDRLREGHYPPKRTRMIEELMRVSKYSLESLELLSDRVITAKFMKMEREEPLEEFAYEIVGSPRGEWIYAQRLDLSLVHSECVVPGLDVSEHLLAWTSMRRIGDLCRGRLLELVDLDTMKKHYPVLRLDRGGR